MSDKERNEILNVSMNKTEEADLLKHSKIRRNRGPINALCVQQSHKDWCKIQSSLTSPHEIPLPLLWESINVKCKSKVLPTNVGSLSLQKDAVLHHFCISVMSAHARYGAEARYWLSGFAKAKLLCTHSILCFKLSHLSGKTSRSLLYRLSKQN